MSKEFARGSKRNLNKLLIDGDEKFFLTYKYLTAVRHTHFF